MKTKMWDALYKLFDGEDEIHVGTIEEIAEKMKIDASVIDAYFESVNPRRFGMIDGFKVIKVVRGDTFGYQEIFKSAWDYETARWRRAYAERGVK